MRWDLHVAGPARKQLERMPAKDRERILAVFVTMRENPFQGDIQHLKNQASAFRRRVGDWRILFDPDPGRHLVVVTAIERRTTTTYRRQ
jgi:mRNA-degrading endonuclease RelE of RelBE toxin-antitoxin system